ncbi:GAP1-N2 domain-containing protein [Candidatus Laterigemmans baculatus]|nr:hypothetical protein [Candidatus Laterigemmans baculatus]
MQAGTMQVEQAIFASADKGVMKGYQLVSQSSGIDRRLAQELCRWAPSHAALAGEEENASSWNYFPAGDDWVAITRTTYGGPEYSRRGGRQVVTMMVAMQLEQFAGYAFNPLAVAKTAFALGHLRLRAVVPEALPTITLPRRSFDLLAEASPLDVGGAAASGGRTAVPPLLSKVVELLRSEQRVAVAGVRDPLAAFEELIARIPLDERPGVSFTTGLKPSARRPFRLHFLTTSDHALRRVLATQGIQCLPEPGKPLATLG